MKDLTTLYKDIKRINEKIFELKVDAANNQDELESLYKELEDIEAEVEEHNSLEKTINKYRS